MGLVVDTGRTDTGPRTCAMRDDREFTHLPHVAANCDPTDFNVCFYPSYPYFRDGDTAGLFA